MLGPVVLWHAVQLTPRWWLWRNDGNAPVGCCVDPACT